MDGKNEFEDSLLQEVAGKTDGQEAEVENTFDDTAQFTNLIQKAEKTDPMGGTTPNTDAAENFSFSIEDMDNALTSGAGLNEDVGEEVEPQTSDEVPAEEVVAEMHNSDDTAVDGADANVLIEGAVSDDGKTDLNQIVENYENFVGFNSKKTSLESFIRESMDGIEPTDDTTVDTSDITDNLPQAGGGAAAGDGETATEIGEGEPVADLTVQDVTPDVEESATEPGEGGANTEEGGATNDESSEGLYNHFTTADEF